jgi:uncharacterized glyoxalase superfamily metalloenzyme YdcJ
MARIGIARYGTVRRGVEHVLARNLERLGSARHGKVRLGSARSQERLGVAW